MKKLINPRIFRGYATILNREQRGILSKGRHADAHGVKTYNIQTEPTLRSVAMQKYITPSGAVSGGWLMSQMDIAGGVVAWDVTKGPIYTVACDTLQFHKAVMPGDLVSFYANLVETNNTSLKVFIEGKIRQPPSRKDLRVTTGTFTYVAIDKNDKPRKVSTGNKERMDLASSVFYPPTDEEHAAAWLEKNLPRKSTTSVVPEP